MKIFLAGVLALVLSCPIPGFAITFSWEFLSFGPATPLGFGQTEFLSDPTVRLFFPPTISVADSGFPQSLLYQYYTPSDFPDPPGPPVPGLVLENSGDTSVFVIAPSPTECTATGGPAPGGGFFVPCADLPRVEFFLGIIDNGTEFLLGGPVVLPGGLLPVDPVCLGVAPVTSTYCGRDGTFADVSVFMTSDANGIWTGTFFSALGGSTLSAGFSGRYVAPGTTVPEPTSILYMATGGAILWLSRRRCIRR